MKQLSSPVANRSNIYWNPSTLTSNVIDTAEFTELLINAWKHLINNPCCCLLMKFCGWKTGKIQKALIIKQAVATVRSSFSKDVVVINTTRQ